MDCTHFLEKYTDYLDRSVEERSLAEYRRHLERCPSCAQYDQVLRKGLNLVRELPTPEPTPDFRQRLQHKLYHIHDDISRPDRSLAGITGIAAIIAALLVASTLSVVRRDGAQVELPPVVIEAPNRVEATTASARSDDRNRSDSRVPGVFTHRSTGVRLLVVPDIGEEPWLVTPASTPVRLFRAPLSQARARPPNVVAGE